MIANTTVPEIKEAVTIYKHFSKDEQMRINAFEREMAVLDHAAELAASRRIGREEGRAEGRAEGKAEVVYETAMKALALGKLTIEEISVISGLPVDKIKEMASVGK